MPEMDGSSAKPPQISEMFQKFALAFKTKTFEFFSDENVSPLDDIDGFSLLDSTEEIIPDQKVVVIKPDPDPSHNFDPPPHSPPPQSPPPQSPPPQSPPESRNPPPQIPPPAIESPEPEKAPPLTEAQIKETAHALTSSVFAAVSAFEASYFQLQSAHVPFVEEHVMSADKVLVSHLQRLSELKKFYLAPEHRGFPFGSCLEAEVEENQSKLRTLGTVSNRLQWELEQKHDEVVALRVKLDEIHRGNVTLSKKLCTSALSPSSDVLLTVKVFDLLLHDASRATHRFTKILIGLMRKAGWDLGLAANAVHPNVDYSKKGHNQYALLSYVCLGMFHGFDSLNFGMEETVSNEQVCSDVDKRDSCLKHLLEHVSSNPMDLLGIHPGCEFSRFCEHKYEKLIHPSMESSIFVNLEEKEAVLNSWRSLSMFYEAFVGMASAIWTLHKLSYTFEPAVEIFQVERGVEFSMIYMEDVTKRLTWPNKGRPLSFIFYTVVMATISVPAATNCRVILLNKGNLIEETCKQTPHHNLCIQYLSSDPRSADADIAGLALIMVNVIKTKANNALDKIHQLLQGSPEPAQKEALISCADRYKAILEADVAQAIAALQKGDPKFAEDGANDAAIEATSCESGFSGKSPLTNENNVMHDVAATTGAIVRQLL